MGGEAEVKTVTHKPGTPCKGNKLGVAQSLLSQHKTCKEDKGEDTTCDREGDKKRPCNEKGNIIN